MDESLGQSAEQSAPAVTQSSSTEPTITERTFRQSEVNDIVGKVRREEAEKASRLRIEQPQYAEQKYGIQQQPNNQASIDEERVRKLATEEFSKQRDSYIAEHQAKTEQEYAQRIVNSFNDKIAAGKDKYEDFEKVTGDIELARFPNVVQLLAEHVDNSHDVLYELGKDRLKMSQLEQLAYMSPRDAITHAKRLAQSIKDNESAGKQRYPNEPLSQQRPSNTGTASGPLSMADLKAKYRG